MILLRTIPTYRLTDVQINDLDQCGFTLVHKPGEIEVWVEDAAKPNKSLEEVAP